MIARITIWIILIFGGAVLGFYLDRLLFQHIHSNIAFHGLSAAFGILMLALVIKISKIPGRHLQNIAARET